MRPIDADRLYNEILSMNIILGGKLIFHPAVRESVLDAIEMSETIDYAPVKRGWLEHIGFLTCRCSECKTTFHELPCENYCPNCGAKMDGKEDGDE